MGTKDDVDAGVTAARKDFRTVSDSTLEDRKNLLDAISAAYQARVEDLAKSVRQEMGAPAWLANAAQVPLGLAHLQVARATLDEYSFEELRGRYILRDRQLGQVDSPLIFGRGSAF